ncbi:50S ribosomal protein L35 protein [Thalictrum thalictroides]|uniref:50S ribosomal protein L35 n=1 Tax=Thalictrum thalictroides TaxID=46969 RepID=A0A7J6XAI8_THATH|nr:50S ribosomal protein L35 protein [Thalictrum thalictroides]
MASATMLQCSLNFFPSSLPSIQSSHAVRLAFSYKKTPSLNLSSSQNISVFHPVLPIKLSSPQNAPTFTVFAAKGYKMKTHKASAKRFRVTGNGKIVRRRAGKQHLLAKKNTKRKNRLSKMIQVNKSDYDNVIGALPYLKETYGEDSLITSLSLIGLYSHHVSPVFVPLIPRKQLTQGKVLCFKGLVLTIEFALCVKSVVCAYAAELRRMFVIREKDTSWSKISSMK